MISEKKKKNIEEHEVIKPPAKNFFYNPTENFFSFSFLRSIKPPPPPTRDPPRWPRHEGETHPAGHTAKHESTIAVIKPAAKPCRADPNGLEVVEPCVFRPGGVGLGPGVVEPLWWVDLRWFVVVVFGCSELIYGGCGGSGWEGFVTAIGYFLWEIIIMKNKKYNI